MDQILFTIAGQSVTPWALVGYLGVLLFSLRWVVQAGYTYTHQKTMLPRAFWYMSIAGSLCLLSYFLFGARDAVGVLSNLFPVLIATFNLIISAREGRKGGPKL